MIIYDREHDWAYELACKHDDFVEARTRAWLEEVEGIALKALKSHGSIYLSFSDVLYKEIKMFQEYVSSQEDWPTDKVFIGTHSEHADVHEFFPHVTPETHAKVDIDFAPDLDLNT